MGCVGTQFLREVGDSTSMGYSMISWTLWQQSGSVQADMFTLWQTTHAQYQPIQRPQWRPACHTGHTSGWMVQVSWCTVCESGRRQEQVVGMLNNRGGRARWRDTAQVYRGPTMRQCSRMWQCVGGGISWVGGGDEGTVPHQPPHVAHWTHPAGARARHVCNALQERFTGRLQELPSNLPPVSLLQVDVCHRGTAPDDKSGGSPTRYPGWVQAGTRLQG